LPNIEKVIYGYHYNDDVLTLYLQGEAINKRRNSAYKTVRFIRWLDGKAISGNVQLYRPSSIQCS